MSGTPYLYLAPTVEAYVKVKGYYRKDGTYVRPHVRSNPNGVKYDNYGYKPSQGRYNKTYGTRGATWDTPTYITDPDYYEGKALYKSGSSGGSVGTTYLNSSSYRYLKKGSYNNGVKELQTAFSKDKSIYPEGITSGYFGSLTERAIQRFQAKHGIVRYGSPSTTGYGRFGPKTQKKFNEIYGSGTQQASVSTAKKQDNYKNTNNKTCSNNYRNSHWYGTKTSSGSIVCDCDSGYKWNTARTMCVIRGYEPAPSAPEDNKTAGKNFYLKNKTCAGLSGDKYGACISYAWNH